MAERIFVSIFMVYLKKKCVLLQYKLKNIELRNEEIYYCSTATDA